MASRIGIDIGGTFTDLIYFDDDTADVRVAKVASTPAAPEHGVVHALHEAVPAERIPVLRYFIHGTTVDRVRHTVRVPVLLLRGQ